MKYKLSSIPEPALGVDYSEEVDLVVPDQSMSLEEILYRFTRGESLPVGFDVNFDEDSDMSNPLNVDLEKIANSDLVDREEFIDKLKDVQRRYNEQEKAKAEAEAKRKEEEFKKLDEKRIRLAARKLAKESSNKSA